MNHLQGIKRNRFFSNLGPKERFKCSNCNGMTEIEAQIKLKANEAPIGLEDYSNSLPQVGLMTDLTHLPKEAWGVHFQCQDCGEIQSVWEYEDLGHTIIAMKNCRCGGYLSRTHPIFCPHCKYNKEADFDVDVYLEGAKKPASDREQMVHAFMEATERADEKRKLERAKEVDDISLTRKMIVTILAIRFRQDFVSDIGRWRLRKSIPDVLLLRDHLRPDTFIWEIHYVHVPLDSDGPGTFEIRMVTDDELDIELDKKSYTTPKEEPMNWFFENLDDILNRDWSANLPKR